jgi:hypothetical protein
LELDVRKVQATGGNHATQTKYRLNNWSAFPDDSQQFLCENQYASGVARLLMVLMLILDMCINIKNNTLRAALDRYDMMLVVVVQGKESALPIMYIQRGTPIFMMVVVVFSQKSTRFI